MQKKEGKYSTVWEKFVEKFLQGESKRWQKIPLGIFLLLVNSGLGWFVYGNHP
jgi:hypothetical protein